VGTTISNKTKGGGERSPRLTTMTDSAIIIGGTRLTQAEELAINELLLRSAGDCEGMPLYRVTWAADDNHGLARKHLPSCPKTNPMDWSCDCPTLEPWKLPVCWHENQCSYHLLSWEPPSPSLELAEGQTRMEGYIGEDYGKGTYACVMHFIDPQTQVPLTNVLPVVVEQIIPRLRAMKEMVMLAQHGANAVLQSKRAQRSRDIKYQLAKKQQKQREGTLELVKEVMHRPFGGEAYSVPGEKSRHGNEILTSDLIRERNT